MPVVRVSWFAGKNHEQKEKVAADITESIVRHTQTDPGYIYVIFDDVQASDWAGGGKLYGPAPSSPAPPGPAPASPVSSGPAPSGAAPGGSVAGGE